jgi:hypothetical protein
VARLWPVKLADRAIPLLYVVVSLIMMAMPAYVCLAFGAAGLVSMVHAHLGESVASIPPPDMKETIGKLYLGWDRVVQHLQTLPWSRIDPRRSTSMDALLDDDSPEDDQREYQEPPRPPEATPVSRIPPL